MSVCDPIQDALDAVEDAGLNIHRIGIFTRTWSGARLGEGVATDSVVYFKPTPRLKEIFQKYGNDKGGTQPKGDLQIRLISKALFPEKTSLNCESGLKNKELYYFIDDELYEFVSMTEKLWHWNISVRKAKKRKLNL